MSDTTEFRRKSNPLKTLASWCGIVVAVVALTGGAAKSFITTPLVLERQADDLKLLRERHAEDFKVLTASDVDTAKEVRALRDLILEVRGDVKAIRNQNRNNQP